MLMLTPSMVTMEVDWGTPMEMAWGTHMVRATTVIPRDTLKASTGMAMDLDMAMVGVTSIDQ